MNTLNRRLLNAGFMLAAVLAPTAVLAQDATAAVMDNSSGWIGGLVVWLLAVGGLISVGVMITVDKRAQAARIVTRR